LHDEKEEEEREGLRMEGEEEREERDL